MLGPFKWLWQNFIFDSVRDGSPASGISEFRKSFGETLPRFSAKKGIMTNYSR